MQKIIIKDGWFRAAGNVYHWRLKHHIFGVGIKLDILKEEREIEVEVEGDLYTLDCRKALDFIRAFQSVKRVGKGRMLGVVSKSILTPVKLAAVPEVSPAKESEPIPETGRLF